MIVLIGGEKGGTGKTTIALALATLRMLDGYSVTLLDADPQRSASHWSNQRALAGKPTFNVFSMRGDDLDLKAKEFLQTFDDVLIDAGGQDSVEMRSGMLGADLMIVPTRASQFDIWTLSHLDDLIEKSININPKLQATVVINNASTHAKSKDTQEAVVAINNYHHLQVNRTIIHERIAHRHAAANGCIACELKSRNNKASTELKSLYHEVYPI